MDSQIDLDKPITTSLFDKINFGKILIGDLSLTEKHCAGINHDGTNCTTKPFFGIRGSGMPEFCNTHKTEKVHVNVIYQLCSITDCYKCALIQYNGICREHFLESYPELMIKKHRVKKDHKQTTIIKKYDFGGDIILSLEKKQCTSCTEDAYYGIKNSSNPQFCFIHKERTHYTAIYQLCSVLNCINRAKKDLNGLCILHCPIDIYDFPQKNISNFIRDNFKLNITFDIIIPQGTSLRRPDIFIETDQFSIVIETDENQHKHKFRNDNYSADKERARLVDLLQDINYKPLLLVRFNPDAYTQNHIKHKSCWYYNKIDGYSFNSDMTIDWSARLNLLKETIIYFLNNPLTEQYKIIKLFYDD
jgi:hypothetical protein